MRRSGRGDAAVIQRSVLHLLNRAAAFINNGSGLSQRLSSSMLAAQALLLCWVVAVPRVYAQRVLPNPVVRDSAGVRIVDYPTLSPVASSITGGSEKPLTAKLRYLPHAFVSDSIPYLDIGGIRGSEKEEFDPGHSVLSALELANGNIVVNDKTRLMFFTAAGRFVRSVGRHGRGPGEFLQTREICALTGDTILAIDFVDGRLSLWDAQGKHLRTFASAGRMPLGACTADGNLIVESRDPVIDVPYTRDRLSRYRLLKPNGGLVRELGMLPAPIFGGGVGRSPSIVIVQDELFVAGARLYEVSVTDRRGRLRRVTRLSGPVSAIAEADWRRRAERMIPRKVAANERAARVADAMLAMPKGPFPAYSRVRVDPAKRIWILDYESQTGWTVLDSTGVLLGRVELPGAGMGVPVQLVGVASDHLILWQHDGDGAAHLRFYRMAASTATASRSRVRTPATRAFAPRLERAAHTAGRVE